MCGISLQKKFWKDLLAALKFHIALFADRYDLQYKK